MNWTKIKIITQSRWIYQLSWMCLIALLLFVDSHSAYAQTTRVDSLQNMISRATSDSERLPLMNELIDELISIDVKQALLLTQKELDLARVTNNKAEEANALNNLGLILYETDERLSSLQHFEDSERMANELGLRELQAHNLMSIAKYHRYASFDSAKVVNNFQKSAEISKSINFYWGAGRSYAKLASFYTRYNQIELCEKYLELAVKYYSKYHDGAKTIAHYYNEVGDKIWHLNPKKSMDFFFKGKEYANTASLMVSLAKAYNYTGDNITAVNYLEEAIPILQKTEKRKRMLGIALAHLAEAYIKLGDYKAADKASDEGINLLSNLGRSDQKGIPVFYRIKGILMEQKGEDQIALDYYTKSLSEAIRVKDTYERIKSVLTIGIFYSTRDLEKGKKFCKKSLKEARQKKHTNLEIEACDCLYKVYKSEASYVEALNYHEQKIILSDSLSTINVKYAIDINNKIAKKDKLIAEQSYQEKIREKELKNQYILNGSLIILSLSGLFFIGFLIRSHKKISQQNKEINDKTEELLKANLGLEHSNKELERFAHITSHDLKTPIRNIINFTGLLRLKLDEKKVPDVTEILDFIENGGKRMNQLIEDILEFSRISDNTTVEQENINLNQLVNEITQLSPNTADFKPVTFEVSTLPGLKWYYSKIFLLFKNIIENGVKYNQSENPIIKIYCTNINGINSICIEDNGIGIEKEYFDRIFIMFNRLHTRREYEGTGLGLATCKKIVDEFEGKISISSEINKGTIFKIELPNHLIYQPDHTDKKQSNVLLVQ